MSQLLSSVAHTLGKSRLAVRTALKVRRLCHSVIKHHLHSGKDYHRNGEAWLVGLVAPSASCFVDVGASIGEWSSFFVQAMPETSRGFLYEPSSCAFERLCQRLGKSARLHLTHAAVSDTQGEMTFFEEPGGGETSSLVPGVSGPGAVGQRVTVTTLDAEAHRHGVDFIDFLKVDAEGYDLHVLRGGSGLLSHQRVGVIQFEYGLGWAPAGSTLAAAYRLLERFGYRVFVLKSGGLFTLDYARYGEYFNYSNFVAVAPKQLPAMEPFVRGQL